ncbi:hypothetical protein NDU88_006027 [Pleurodeles waltl]|uniref:Uncharacterized protein n=1 Tax=Pleurodeles waltl TaxID=8319 RepID=A0AAV7VPD2_PLEWA|nr:hypothetical protein NDU88_006027 [Pleurodeles waltl]
MTALQGVKLFLAITGENQSEEKEDTSKSDKSLSEDKKKKKTYVEGEDSDVEDLITQVLRNRPQPYAKHEGCPSTSSAPTAQAQVSGAAGPVQTDNGQLQGIVQSTLNAVTTLGVQAQMHSPPVQRIYPEIPIFETTSNLVVPTKEVIPMSLLVQTEPTPMLLPQAQPQPQDLPKFTPMTGTKSDVTPVRNQSIGVALPQNAGVRVAPDAVSLPITVGPAVPLFVQNKLISGEQGEMSQSLVRRRVRDHVQIVVPADLWVECKRAVDCPTSEPERERVTGAPSPELMKHYYKVIEFLKTRILPKNIDWQRIDRTVQELKESPHTYYERLLKAFKEYSGKEAIEPKDMLHFVFRFIEELRPEIGQMIKSHLICWQAKPIDEVLQYAKYWSDEIELKQKKLKEKVMVMQIKAAHTGVQGALMQQIPQQQGTVMFQPQTREVQINRDDEEEQAPETENETINEEYPLIEFFTMFTVKEFHADLQGTVQENVWDLTGKEVGLIKGVEPIKITLKPNAVFPQLPQYNMAQDVLMKVAQITGGFEGSFEQSV